MTEIEVLNRTSPASVRPSFLRNMAKQFLVVPPAERRCSILRLAHGGGRQTRVISSAYLDLPSFGPMMNAMKDRTRIKGMHYLLNRERFLYSMLHASVVIDQSSFSQSTG